jgi:4-amino-4-deoxy-L-arabinose transferase-like glycosyltransferase
VPRETSVASPDVTTRYLSRVFWAIGVLLFAIKFHLAATLAPFGDEAFYWQESRALAWSYTDVPPATALLIHLGERLFGHSLLGMRSLFLLLGSALPLLVVGLGRHFADRRAGLIAGIGWQLLPLAGTLGVMAMPDVPLTFAALILLHGLLLAINDKRCGWRLLGLGLALAWLSHYRAAMLLPGGLGVLLLHREGRALWARPGLWAALAVGALGLLPLLLFNREHDWSGLSFQLVERHPWQFHASGLLQPLEQLLVCTPVLYGLMLYALWTCVRRGADAGRVVLAWAGISVVLGYFLFGLFGDDLRFRLHWPLPAYAPALFALGLLVSAGRLRRIWLRLALVLAGLGLVCALVYLSMAARPEQALLLARYKAFPYNFVGWNEVAARTRELLAQQPGAAHLLLADNFLLGAELDFQFDAALPVYSLDHPRNIKHGRAPQLALWQRDEAGLRASHAGARVLLIVEETTGSERERLAWQQGLCRRLHALQPLDRLDLFDGRKRFAWYLAHVPAPAEQPVCTTAP